MSFTVMIKERLSVYMSTTLKEYSRTVALESTNIKERTYICIRQVLNRNQDFFENH